MTHYMLNATNRTVNIDGEDVDPQQYPVLRTLLGRMRFTDVVALTYCDAKGLGAAECQDCIATWDAHALTITTPWDTVDDMEEVYSALHYAAKDAEALLPHALDPSAEILGPVHVIVGLGKHPRVSVYRGAVRVAEVTGDQSFDLPMQERLLDWCTETQGYAQTLGLPAYIGVRISEGQILFRRPGGDYIRAQDDPSTEEAAREFRKLFDALLNAISPSDKENS